MTLGRKVCRTPGFWQKKIGFSIQKLLKFSENPIILVTVAETYCKNTSSQAEFQVETEKLVFGSSRRRAPKTAFRSRLGPETNFLDFTTGSRSRISTCKLLLVFVCVKFFGRAIHRRDSKIHEYFHEEHFFLNTV